MRLHDYTGCNPNILGNEKDAVIASLMAAVARLTEMAIEKDQIIAALERKIDPSLTPSEGSP